MKWRKGGKIMWRGVVGEKEMEKEVQEGNGSLETEMAGGRKTFQNKCDRPLGVENNLPPAFHSDPKAIKSSADNKPTSGEEPSVVSLHSFLLKRSAGSLQFHTMN
jgi:hypothetical protein